jgi:nicotinamide phosphoribosyltransferase
MSKYFKPSALTNADSYKLGHAEQYPDGTTTVFSNFTARSETHFGVPEQYKDGHIVWFGMQTFLHELSEVWKETFFSCDKETVVKEFGEFVAPFCGPNGFDLSRIEALHDLGYLPLQIKSLPEGSRVNIGIPVLTITNTHSDFYWLPNFLETYMSCELWKSSTSATMSYVYRNILNKYADLTGGNQEFIAWQGHDFSLRGMSGIVDGAKSGSGHLLSFTGTDNLPAVKLINDVYHGKNTFVGGSVPATEHSVMCAGGMESELETFDRLITNYPSGVVSIVSDTWDFWNVINNIAVQLKDKILARVPDQFGLAKVVFRPDSGDPVKIICGDFDAPSGSSEYKGAVECLWDTFGGTTNDKGYRTLNQRVGLIYGDSITPYRCEEILMQLRAKGFASDNCVFGIGSYTFQYQTRDTLGFAMKATYVEINNEGLAIFKDPVTDSGTKKSAKGLLRVEQVDGEFVLHQEQSLLQEGEGELKTMFLNGNVILDEDFETIRNRLWKK